MRILVTGSNGQLGHEMRRLAAEHALHTYYFTDVDELDICNPAAVARYFDTHPIDCVVNCAAYTAVDQAEENEDACIRLNSEAPGHLARVAARCGASLVHISTDYVFSGIGHRPYVETDEPSPQSVYGRTKLAGERLVTQLCPQAMIIRTAWLYSPYGHNFVKTMLQLGRERDAIGVVADQVGTPTYAADLAQAIYTALETGIVPGVYHFSDEGVCSWYDFAKAIHRIAGLTGCKVNPLHASEYPTRARRPAYSVLDKAKIKTTYKLNIPHWEESLQACIQRLRPLAETL